MAKKTKALRGIPLLVAAVNQITQNPETWFQATWHKCDSVHCIGGWMQVLGGKPQSEMVSRDIAELLPDISAAERKWLLDYRRTLWEIWNFAECCVSNRAGFDRAGFNRAGFDRDGKNLPLLKVKSK